jgi:hypothetical protein
MMWELYGLYLNSNSTDNILARALSVSHSLILQTELFLYYLLLHISITKQKRYTMIHVKAIQLPIIITLVQFNSCGQDNIFLVSFKNLVILQ